MDPPIVLRVRQVVNCLLFPHYLSVARTRCGKGNSPSFHLTADEQIVLTGCSLVYVTLVTSPSISAVASSIWISVKDTCNFC